MLKTLRVLLLLVIVWAGTPFTTALPAAQPPKPAAQEGFVPIDQLPPDEQLPAAPLLVAAYAVAWLVIAGYLWSVWRRIGRVEHELAEVGRRIAAGGRR